MQYCMNWMIDCMIAGYNMVLIQSWDYYACAGFLSAKSICGENILSYESRIQVVDWWLKTIIVFSGKKIFSFFFDALMHDCRIDFCDLCSADFSVDFHRTINQAHDIFFMICWNPYTVHVSAACLDEAYEKMKNNFCELVISKFFSAKQYYANEDADCIIHIVVWIKMFKNIFVMKRFILILMKILNYGYKKESSKKGCKESSSEKRS